MTENEAKNFHVNTDMFGQYAKIPTGYSEDLHIYKIITRFQSNSYCDVPIIGLRDSTLHEEVTDVLNVIHCGVDESKVIRVALKDCQIVENKAIKELQQYQAIGTVEECREAVEKQKPKKILPLTYGLLFENGWRHKCPNCGCAVGENIYHPDVTKDYEFCSMCGQAIYE